MDIDTTPSRTLHQQNAGRQLPQKATTGSPSKRIKLEDDAPASMTLRPQPLPLPLELLTLATRYVYAAHSLTVKLAKRPACPPSPSESASPSKHDHQVYEKEQLEQADLLSIYRRYIAAAITALRYVTRAGSGGSDGIGDARIDLRAKAMLAELLIRETKETSEAEALLSKGSAAAAKHDALLHFRYHFISLQIELALSSRNVKYARTTCRKAIQQVSQSHIPFPLWHYRLLFIHIDICENYERDHNATMVVLQELLAFATSRGDAMMEWIVKLQMARIAILKGDEVLSAKLVRELLNATGYRLSLTNAELEEAEKQQQSSQGQAKPNPLAVFSVQPGQTNIQLPKPVILHFVILLCIWQGHVGEMKAAKSNLKKVHALLDEPESIPGELEGWIQIPVNSAIASSTNASCLYLAVLPRQLFYNYTFLITTIVQLEPSGVDPKCMIYALHGLTSLQGQVAGTDKYGFPPTFSLREVESRVNGFVRIMADLSLYHTELLLMRSKFDEAERSILELVNLTRTHNLWEAYASRICLLRGVYYHALGNMDEAIRCYTVAWQKSPKRSQISIVSRASIFFIRLGQGKIVNLSSSSLGKRRTSTVRMLERPDEEPDQEDLEAFAKGIMKDCADSAPSMQMLGMIIDALTIGEIVKAKTTLTAALSIANETNCQFIKPLILSLLSCYFLHTRNEQAGKMLISAHKICRSMGGLENDKRDKDGNRIIGPEIVGLARLGLWTGKQLLDLYKASGDKDASKRQIRYNGVHADALEKQDRMLGT